ncbi:MAG TPA: BrnA antitoxin family protein [Rhodopila sp.]|nr:BrnA antitoxin family protein [Rhodopila sp.]
MLQNGGDRSDWQAARALSREEVERLADEEDGALPEDWESSVVIGLPPRKQAVHIRLDVDILDWFREHGPGYQTRINAVLRSFVDARRKAEVKSRD